MTRTPTRRNESVAVTSAATVELPRDLKMPAVGRAKSRSKTTTIKPAMVSQSTIKALTSKPLTTGGAYSMTKRERVESTTPPNADTIEVDVGGRTVKLSRRDARALADKLLRALK